MQVLYFYPVNNFDILRVWFGKEKEILRAWLYTRITNTSLAPVIVWYII